jgi:hypothetical protein
MSGYVPITKQTWTLPPPLRSKPRKVWKLRVYNPIPIPDPDKCEVCNKPVESPNQMIYDCFSDIYCCTETCREAATDDSERNKEKN